jgi:Kyakuja-Dileera-Zisupton transposase
MEKGMSVPASVLDACGDAFVAADDKREKASTRFFTDTGLMAMLCRHDRVLWLVNMTSAGERQHYALTLIRELFKNIPDDMRVGLLYDIGCQLERSCRKYQLLDESILNRIQFGISVFHAYGHQWACQVIYHPRKREGFGLSDGEGCERLWSALKHLIPSLRVSGVGAYQ